MTYTINQYGVEIIDSYKVTDTSKMSNILKYIFQDKRVEEIGFDRKMSSCIAEWKFHNFCYKINFKRDSAKNVFLDCKFTSFRGKLEKFIYSLLAVFYIEYD